MGNGGCRRAKDAFCGAGQPSREEPAGVVRRVFFNDTATTEIYTLSLHDALPIATFDLHANVSRRMTSNVDVFVGYLENPHTDVRERGAEAARHMRELIAGAKTAVVMVKLPLTPPSITLLTASGPYSDIIRYGQTRVGGDIMNVSILAGSRL